MNIKDAPYKPYALVREMMETPEIIRRFQSGSAQALIEKIQQKEGLFLTGEGSSRIFPARHAQYVHLQQGGVQPVITEGATQALEYDLSRFAVLGASNSGKTKEVIRLFNKLRSENHDTLLGLTAHAGTKLGELAHQSHVLNCGSEDAVAATKSVVEQALFMDAVIRGLGGRCMCGRDLLADHVAEVLTLRIDPGIIELLSQAETLYFAGRNTGVAEELTLKTNEITRKRSDYLEGTYAVHGIEEVMDPHEAVVVIEPFESEEEKFEEVLVKGVGMPVIAIASRATRFPTIRIPDQKEFASYIALTAGWNLLVEIGIHLGIDLDKPVRARKVGNEYGL